MNTRVNHLGFLTQLNSVTQQTVSFVISHIITNVLFSTSHHMDTEVMVYVLFR